MERVKVRKKRSARSPAVYSAISQNEEEERPSSLAINGTCDATITDFENDDIEECNIKETVEMVFRFNNMGNFT